MSFGNVEIIGLIAGVITSLGFIPQLFKGFRTKKLNDVSYFMPIVLAFDLPLYANRDYDKPSIERFRGFLTC